MNYRPTNYERETVIVFNEGEKTAKVYTHNARLIRRLEENAKTLPDLYKLIESDEFSKTYEVPKKSVNITKARKYSDEEIEIIKQRFNKS